ncbi:hypothetical protein [Burkholderia metallica]|nr:hypothetical protein [Burkholderia metallica]
MARSRDATCDPAGVLDCSKAFVDFPGIDQSNPFGSTWAPAL